MTHSTKHIQNIKSLSNVKLSNIASNAKIQRELSERIELDATSEAVSRYILNFSVALSSTDVVLSCTSKIKQYNKTTAYSNAYALIKCTEIINSLKTDVLCKSKTFTSHVVAHLLNMTRHSKAMSTKQRQSSSAICIENDSMKATDIRNHYAINTADTQTSSTAFATHIMNITEYDKENKMLSLKDSDESKQLLKMCKASAKK